jgi:uncharacterized membrane protein
MTLLPLILGLVLFLGMHAFTMNREARWRLIERIGAGRYRIAYSVAAVLGLVLIIWGYGHYRDAGMIPVWYPPDWTRHITFLLVLLAFILLATAHAPSHIRAFVKHPMITAVILWSLGHLLVRGDLGSILMFGGFFAWGVLARISMAMRAAGDVQGPAPVRAPRWSADAISVVLGVVVYVAFIVWGHPWLIGVPLIRT